MADSNSFLSPWKCFPIAQEKTFRDVLGICFYFIMKIYIKWTHQNRLEYTQHTNFVEDRKDIPKLSTFVIWTGAVLNHQWPEPPMSSTNFQKMLEQLKLYFTCIVAHWQTRRERQWLLIALCTGVDPRLFNRGFNISEGVRIDPVTLSIRTERSEQTIQTQIGRQNINAHTKFGENPLTFIQVIARKRKYGRTDIRMDGRTDTRTTNVIL